MEGHPLSPSELEQDVGDPRKDDRDEEQHTATDEGAENPDHAPPLSRWGARCWGRFASFEATPQDTKSEHGHRGNDEGRQRPPPDLDQGGPDLDQDFPPPGLGWSWFD